MILRPSSRYHHLLWVIALILTVSGTLLLAACGSTSNANESTGKEANPFPTMATTTTSNSTIFQVSILDNGGSSFFSPATLTIPKGATVIWTNMSAAPHSINNNTNAFSSPGNLLRSQTFQMVFTTAGTYTYHCGLHPYMKGTITVTA